MNISKKQQSGFTLVEIAIVLVIIGLILGGVLKGQEMIQSAKVKSQMQQIDGISAAVNTYKDKFNAMPGDDSNATTNTGDSALTNGNADGVYATAEGDQHIWEHLAAAGMLGGYTAAPNGRFLNTYGYQTFVRSNYAGLPGAVVCTLVPNSIAAQIDQKRDDGAGATGSMRRSDQAVYPTTSGDSWICVSL